MKHSYTRAAQGLLAISASLLLIACGGGNNTSVPLVPGTDVPVAATQDGAGAFSFIVSVVAKGEADTESPLALGDAELAGSDTADSMPIAA